jgi:predicted MPP superfamily phosphohydrolase
VNFILEDREHRRRLWQERRAVMEAQPSGKRWRGHLRKGFYGTAWRVHDALRPTAAFKLGARRALRMDLTELTLSFADLPPAFDGYRILHLTDLHLDNIEDTAAETAAQVAGIESDLCVITGDIRDNIHAPLAPLMKRLETIVASARAPDGILSVLGNHDGAAMVAPMEDIGIHVLLNETVTFSRGQDDLHLTGLDDVHRFHTEEANAALDAAPDGFCIALVHSPEVAGHASERHRLYLTGHTHGGQICLPGQRNFHSGLKRHRDLGKGLWNHGEMVGYTSRGIGACIVPFRTYCPSEIVRVTLKRGPERLLLNGDDAAL